MKFIKPYAVYVYLYSSSVLVIYETEQFKETFLYNKYAYKLSLLAHDNA